MAADDRVREMIEPLLDEQGLELVDVEHSGAILRVTVDRAEGGGIDLDTVSPRVRGGLGRARPCRPHPEPLHAGGLEPRDRAAPPHACPLPPLRRRHGRRSRPGPAPRATVEWRAPWKRRASRGSPSPDAPWPTPTSSGPTPCSVGAARTRDRRRKRRPDELRADGSAAGHRAREGRPHGHAARGARQRARVGVQAHARCRGGGVRHHRPRFGRDARVRPRPRRGRQRHPRMGGHARGLRPHRRADRQAGDPAAHPRGRARDEVRGVRGSRGRHRVGHYPAVRSALHPAEPGQRRVLLPQAEQVPYERYEHNARLKAYIVEVRRTTKGPQIVVSRTHPGLIKRLFELEVPEISDGIVELKAVAREPGHRTKIAVWSNDANVDPVGACVGARGARVRMVVNELRGEKVDIVPFSDGAERVRDEGALARQGRRRSTSTRAPAPPR